MSEHNDTPHGSTEGGSSAQQEDSRPVPSSGWYRLPYMLLFVVVFEIAEIIVYVTALVQFVLRMVTGHPNERLRTFGGDLSRYVGGIVAYLTYKSDAVPYPFGPWPTA